MSSLVTGKYILSKLSSLMNSLYFDGLCKFVFGGCNADSIAYIKHLLSVFLTFTNAPV